MLVFFRVDRYSRQIQEKIVVDRYRNVKASGLLAEFVCMLGKGGEDEMKITPQRTTV